MDLNQVIKDVVLTKTCSIKPFKDSPDSKSITLRVKFDGVTLQSVFDKAVSGSVIQWQNGPGRKNYDGWEDRQTVDITFSAPGRTAIDPIAALIGEAKASGIDVTDKAALSKWITEKAMGLK